MNKYWQNKNLLIKGLNEYWKDLLLINSGGINYEITIDGKAIESAKNKTINNGGGTSTIHVKVYWDQTATEIPENTTKKLLVNLEYVQA